MNDVMESSGLEYSSSAVREAYASRHNGDTIESPPEIPRHHCAMVFRGVSGGY